MFQNVLDRFDYLFVLDRACIQFEPDDPVFLKTVYMTYEHILAHRKFDLLRSTRYFGPMAFYYAFESKIDDLLADMIERKLLADAASLINLYYILNEKESELDLESDNYLSIIKVNDNLTIYCLFKFNLLCFFFRNTWSVKAKQDIY